MAYQFASWERDLFGGGESRFVINTCGTHHSRDLSTCDSSLHIPHGSRDGTPLDSRPEMTQWAPSMTDNRKCVGDIDFSSREPILCIPPIEATSRC
jgi:hypothetical protein